MRVGRLEHDGGSVYLSSLRRHGHAFVGLHVRKGVMWRTGVDGPVEQSWDVRLGLWWVVLDMGLFTLYRRGGEE